MDFLYNVVIMMKVWTAFLLIGAAASILAWAVALCHENRVCPFAAAARFVRGLPWGGRLALLPLFVALIVYGGTKNSGGVGELGVEGANQVSGRVESVDDVDNVANVEVLPVTNSNTQLGTGNIGTMVTLERHLQNPGGRTSSRAALAAVPT